LCSGKELAERKWDWYVLIEKFVVASLVYLLDEPVGIMDQELNRYALH
jgi:hypothetical protein